MELRADSTPNIMVTYSLGLGVYSLLSDLLSKEERSFTLVQYLGTFLCL